MMMGDSCRAGINYVSTIFVTKGDLFLYQGRVDHAFLLKPKAELTMTSHGPLDQPGLKFRKFWDVFMAESIPKIAFLLYQRLKIEFPFDVYSGPL